MIAAVLTFGIVLGFFAYCFAQIEAEHDAQAIAHGQAIDHRREWMQRAGIVVCVVVAFYCFTALLWGWLLWPCLLLLVMAAAVFSCEFRRSLNEIRGLHPHYVSPSNVYDRLMIRWSLGWCPSVSDHAELYDSHLAYINDIHDAGRLAHHVETITALACYAGAIIITYIHAT